MTSVDLAVFAQDAQAHASRIEATKTPEVLTVDGRAALVVQDAEGYQALLDQVEKAALLASLRQAICDGEAGLGMSATDARRELRAKHGF